jgi:alpha-D-xyloside xylohydrolase
MPWTKVTAVAEYAVEDETVTFTCETESDGERLTDVPWRVPVTLQFLGPETFRFEIQANPEARVAPPATDTERRNYPELTPAEIAEPVSLSVTETEASVIVETDALTITVGRDPWDFEVARADGTALFEEERSLYDVRGDTRVPPLGFQTEEINDGPHRVDRTGTVFRLDPSERIYGLGEQFTEFDRRGREFDLWHVEPLGTETERAYKNIPFHLSTSGYGMLVDTTSRVHYDLGHSATASASVDVRGDRFSCVFFCQESFREIVETYTGLTGRPDRPPKWSFGTWMSRLGYESRAELERITDRLRAEEIPSDVVHLDPFWMRENHACDLEWDREQFPNPEGMIDDLHEKGFRLSLWEHPHVPVGTDAFETGVREGYFVDTPQGKPYVMDRTCQGSYRGAIVDFTDPDAVAWWQGKHHDLLEMGVDVFKTDYGEYLPEDAVLSNGRGGAAMHNLYPYLYNQAVYEATRDANGEDGFVWARSAWVGSGKFPVHWGGDPHPSRSGMAAALRGGLSASLSGIAFWSHDIGGFRGTPSAELYVRWAQFGLLSSHARCHGTTPREPWAFGERATELFREYAQLRYRLLPYIYTYAEVAARTGLPVARPFVLEYPDDPTAQRMYTEYLLGEDLLVAPVFSETGSRSVYLPAGTWHDYWTGEAYEGGQTVDLSVELADLPLFQRAGSVVPRREATQSVQPGTPSWLELVTVLDENGAATGRFYDEDRDQLVSVSVAVDDETLTVTTDDEVEGATPDGTAGATPDGIAGATPDGTAGETSDTGDDATAAVAVSAATVEVVVDDVDPAQVVVDGTALSEVGSNPDSGEWTATDDGVTAVVDGCSSGTAVDSSGEEDAAGTDADADE